MAHTNEFLRGMFAAYMGCEVQYLDINNKKIVATLTGVSVNDGLETTYKRRRKSITGDYVSGDYLSFKPNGNHNTDALHCKPILTPLSEITDEDAVEVAKMYYDKDIHHTIGSGKNLIMHIIHPDVSNILVYSYSLIYILDYLRSRHYDCGYMHIPSLIAADLAISSKTN